MSIEELFEILQKENPSVFIKDKEKQVFELIPELEKCKGFDQHSEWHPYDVYDHILNVVDNVENNKILRMSALFHDIGKPDNFTMDQNGVGHFYGHWETSRIIFESFSDKHNLNERFKEKVSKLIQYHDKNLGVMDDNSINQIIKLFTKEELVLLYKLKKADLLAQNSKYHFLLDEYKKQENVYKLMYERRNKNE